MGLFTKKEKIKTIPPSKVTKTARGQLESFIKDQPFGKTPKIPRQRVAGLTPLQRALQGQTAEAVRPEDFALARDAFRMEAGRGTDVATSPEFAAFRRQIADLQTEQQTDIRQRAELGGQLQSTPAAAIEAENRRKFDTALLQEFSRLEQQNRQQKLSAAAGLTQLGSQRLGQISQASQIAEADRAIEQARNDAVYNQALQTVLFPYQAQLQLFAPLLNLQDNFAVTGGGATSLGTALSFGAGGLSSFAGTEAGAGALAGLFGR